MIVEKQPFKTLETLHRFAPRQDTGCGLPKVQGFKRPTWPHNLYLGGSKACLESGKGFAPRPNRRRERPRFLAFRNVENVRPEPQP
jgi:hypothetical protein